MAFSFVNNPGISPFYDLAALRSCVAELNVTSYTNPGGETLTPAMFGMSRILGVQVIGAPRGFVYNYTTSTGKLTIAQDATPAAAAALPEIPNATNHGTIRVFVIGQ